MIIQEDTRQKPDKNKHIREQLETLGYDVRRFGGMAVGDYQILGKGDIVVDTKKNMNEVENNLIHDHERFRNECKLAQEAGIKLIILVQDPHITSIGGVFAWTNPRVFYSKGKRKPTSGRTLGKIMMSMQEKYGCEWHFTTKAKCGETIVKLLGGSDEKM